VASHFPKNTLGNGTRKTENCAISSVLGQNKYVRRGYSGRAGSVKGYEGGGGGALFFFDRGGLAVQLRQSRIFCLASVQRPSSGSVRKSNRLELLVQGADRKFSRPAVSATARAAWELLPIFRPVGRVRHSNGGNGVGSQIRGHEMFPGTRFGRGRRAHGRGPCAVSETANRIISGPPFSRA